MTAQLRCNNEQARRQRYFAEIRRLYQPLVVEHRTTVETRGFHLETSAPNRRQSGALSRSRGPQVMGDNLNVRMYCTVSLLRYSTVYNGLS